MLSGQGHRGLYHCQQPRRRVPQPDLRRPDAERLAARQLRPWRDARQWFALRASASVLLLRGHHVDGLQRPGCGACPGFCGSRGRRQPPGARAGIHRGAKPCGRKDARRGRLAYLPPRRGTPGLDNGQRARRGPFALEACDRRPVDAGRGSRRNAPAGCLRRPYGACLGCPRRTAIVDLYGRRTDRFAADGGRGAGAVRLQGRLGVLPPRRGRPAGVAFPRGAAGPPRGGLRTVGVGVAGAWQRAGPAGRGLLHGRPIDLRGWRHACLRPGTQVRADRALCPAGGAGAGRQSARRQAALRPRVPYRRGPLRPAGSRTASRFSWGRSSSTKSWRGCRRPTSCRERKRQRAWTWPASRTSIKACSCSAGRRAIWATSPR